METIWKVPAVFLQAGLSLPTCAGKFHEEEWCPFLGSQHRPIMKRKGPQRTCAAGPAFEPQIYTVGVVLRDPNTNETTARIRKTTNNTQAIWAATNSVRHNPKMPATMAIIKKSKAARNMILFL
jgi:hypothetical protein